ncbi:MAG: hypothetical protein EBW04_07555, partial [Betaproteobacteria bacterium]|nr:hypothetical protein [Betaproteobacteria bacterium]
NSNINTGGSGQVGSSLGGHTGTIYGNDGGDNATQGVGDPTRGAGGGGAGAAAADSTTSSTSDDGQSDGGDGIQNDITGTNLYWGGGGGGAAHTNGYAGDGGLGGGGGGSAQSSGRAGTGGTGGLNNGSSGSTGSNQNGGAGGANTGGGGGGGTWNDSLGGAGGSGIVVIRHTYTQTTYNNHNLTINSGAGAVDMNGNVSHIGTLSINSASAASEISGIIDGVTALTKQGAGTLTLSGTNTYTGSTTIAAGTISIASSANLGATPGSADADNIIFNGGTVTTTASFTLGTNKGITMTGNGTINTGAYTLTYGGVTTGSGNLTKTGAGTLILSGANGHTGDLIISQGTATVSGTLSNSTDVSVASGAVYDVDASDTIQSLTGAGNVELASITLTTGDAGNDEISGVISGAGNLTKQGAGTLTLSGTNTYTGKTSINGGSISIAADSGLGTAPGSFDADNITFAGGTLATTTTFTLNSNRGVLANGYGYINVASSTTLTYDGVVSGSDILYKSGSGLLHLSGTNTNSAGYRITGGTLRVSGSIGSGAYVYITSASGIYDVDSSDTIETLSGTGYVQLATGITLTTGDAGDDTYSGVISGAGNLTKQGAGTLTLSGTNTYTGQTNINAGTLAVTVNDALGTNAAGTVIASGATLDLQNVTYSTTEAIT